MGPMNETERQAFLAEMHMGVIAIDDPNGDRGPLAVPVWYSYEPGGEVAVIMSASSRKGRAIAAAGRFSICAQQEALPYKYVMAEGPVVSEREGTYEDTLAMATRYLGNEMGRQYADANAGGGTIYSMRPERWFSTDYTPD